MHITDTHLFVDKNGRTRSSHERSRLIRMLARLGVKDLDFASADMTAAFSDALRRAVDLERSVLPEGAPVVAAHTGDTEAFGSSDERHVYAGFDIVFVPINTVNSHALRAALLAYGRISPHPPNPSHTEALDIVDGYHLDPNDLNIAVMHHPPHFYRPLTLRDRLGIGHLEDSSYVSDRLAAAGIDLVLDA